MLAAATTSCKDDVASAGSSALTADEMVKVCAETMQNIASETQLWGKPNFMTPDSFLIGECHSPRYGTLKANLLTQFAAPVGSVYPENSVVDSASLWLYYRSWYGDGEAPLSITAYELDSCMDYNTRYTSDLDLKAFCKMDRPATSKNYVLAAAHCADSMYSSSAGGIFYIVKCPLTKELTNKLFHIRDYESQAAFNQAFKGLLVTSNYGSSTGLYVIDVAITLYYHYSYLPTPESKDSVRLSDSRIFYANSEVRQVNHYEYPDGDEVRAQLCAAKDTNYIITPANMYTRLSFPMKQMVDSMNEHVGDKRTYVNQALLTVDVLNYPNNALEQKQQGWAKPATTMMLIKEDAYERFFEKNELPSDTCALCCDMITAVDTNNVYWNFFNFDMSSIFAQQLREANAADTLRMLLVPVKLDYATTAASYNVSAVKLVQSVTATAISSAKNPSFPMDIEVIYSGFSKGKITQ